MKRPTFLGALLCLFLNISLAQNNTIPLQEQLEEAVSTLDLTQVPTGLLADKSYTPIDLKIFDGQILNDSNWTIRPIYEMLYLGIQAAATTTTVPLPPLDNILDTLDNLELGAPIPLSLLLFEYNSLRQDALDENLLTFADGHLYDVPERQESPYLNQTLFTTLIGQDEVDRLHLRFHLRSDFLFTNFDETIQQLEIDFDNGQGWQLYEVGDIISIPYAEQGTKRITSRYTFQNGEEVLAQSLLHIELPEGEGGLRAYNTQPDTHLVVPGAAGYVYYNNNCPDPKIRKPFIIIEGFDPIPGVINYDQFYDLVSVKYNTPSGQRLIDDFHDGGYDIIFINFGDGGEAIPENAQSIKAMIRLINDYKAAAGSVEENIVLGVSMGGVVGKWALREMELSPEDDHETKQFITLDSPLRGANISPALQGLVFGVGNHKIAGIKRLHKLGNNNALNAGMETINTPAARQMLFYHLGQAGNIRAWHDQFYAELAALGQLDVEHIALSNGSQIGEGQLFNAGENLMDKAFEPDFILDAIIGPDWAERLLDIGLALLNAGTKYEFNAWALPGNEDNVVFEASFTETILPLVAFHETIKIKVPSNALPLDSSPGGNRPFNRVRPGNTDLDLGWKYYGFCFVPSFSAMDIDVEDVNFDLSNPAAVVNSNNTPIGAYVATKEALYRWRDLDVNNPLNPPQHNQEHALLNRRLATFLVYLMVGHQELTGVSSLSTGIYNYGTGSALFNPGCGQDPTANYAPRATPSIIDKNFTLTGKGQLWVNRNNRIAFIDSVNNQFNSGEPFHLFIRKGCESATTLTIRNGGKMHIGENAFAASVTVEKESALWVRSGGKLVVENGSKVIVQSGATLTLGQGSRLTVKEGGEVLVEPGGEIRIYEGAVIDLKDPDSNIHIQGWMTVKGTFDFPGYGFFQFDESNTLILEAEFVLEGRGKGERFLRLNEDAQLNVGSGKITFRNGGVSYRENSRIRIGTGGEAYLWFTEFSGKGTGIIAQSAKKITARDCDFLGLDYGLYLQDMSTTNQRVTLLLSNFYDCEQGVFAYQCHTLDVNTCGFYSSEKGQVGLYAEQVNWVAFNASTIDGFNQMDRAGVELINTQTMTMNGGVIRNCYHGIHCPDIPGSITNVANISLSGFATLEDNSFGITIDRGGIIGGTVSMDCARLINNTGAGIAGTDVVLQIDACNNAGSPDCSTNVKPNHFEAGTTDASQGHLGLFFDICYENLQVNTVSANGNYWKWNGALHANPKYLLGYSGNSGICNNGVTLDDAHKPNSPPANCTGTITPPGDDEIGMLHQSNATDRESATASSDENIIKVFPNPASGTFHIEVPSESYQIRILDLTGTTLVTKTGERVYIINAEKWPKGLYLVEVRLRTQDQSIFTKMALH